MNRSLHLVFAWTAASSVLMGCASSAHEVRQPLSMPQDWEVRAHPEPDVCLPVDGVYENVGTGTFGNHPGMTAARLDAALGRAMPPSREPQRIAVTLDSQHQILKFGFLGSNLQPYEFSVPVDCEKGWLTWSASLSDEYLADGISLKESTAWTRLRGSSDDGLIVHSRGEAVYSNALVGRDRESTEWWAKFPRDAQ